MVLLETITTYFIFFAGGVSLLVSLSELLVRCRRVENYLFAAFLICFGLLMFQIGFIINRMVLVRPGILYLHMTFIYLVGPISYFCYFLIILPRDSLPARMFLYMLPAAIALAFDIYFMFLPAEMQVDYIRALIYSGDFSRYPLMRFLYALAGVQIVIYLGTLLVRFLVIWIREGRATVVLVSMLFLMSTLAASLLELSGYCLALPAYIKWGGFMLAFLFICVFLVNQRFPRFLQLIMDEAEKKSRGKSQIENLDVESIIIRLKECMTEQKMFMNEELTLKDLAEELSITPPQLTQILNGRLATNFNNFVNQYRIRESKMLLIDEPERSVISIAFMVGFNTKSSFYNAFSRFTGTTPQDYRRENL